MRRTPWGSHVVGIEVAHVPTPGCVEAGVPGCAHPTMLDPQDPRTSILEMAEHGRDGFWASIVDDDDFHRDVLLAKRGRE